MDEEYSGKKGYYVSTVGGNKKAIQKYVQEQERKESNYESAGLQKVKRSL